MRCATDLWNGDSSAPSHTLQIASNRKAKRDGLRLVSADRSLWELLCMT